MRSNDESFGQARLEYVVSILVDFGGFFSYVSCEGLFTVAGLSPRSQELTDRYFRSGVNAMYYLSIPNGARPDGKKSRVSASVGCNMCRLTVRLAKRFMASIL